MTPQKPIEQTKQTLKIRADKEVQYVLISKKNESSKLSDTDFCSFTDNFHPNRTNSNGIRKSIEKQLPQGYKSAWKHPPHSEVSPPDGASGIIGAIKAF